MRSEGVEQFGLAMMLRLVLKFRVNWGLGNIYSAPAKSLKMIKIQTIYKLILLESLKMPMVLAACSLSINLKLLKPYNNVIILLP